MVNIQGKSKEKNKENKGVVSFYLLGTLRSNFPTHDIGVHHDNGIDMAEMDIILNEFRKNHLYCFSQLSLKIIVATCLSKGDFLDASQNLNSYSYKAHPGHNALLPYFSLQTTHFTG